jgi:hypothetical protein
VSYSSFFSGSASVAGALVGLLFVALSVAPERLRVAHGGLEHQAVAATAFTGLVDALFISLAGLVPGGATDGTMLVLGLIGLSSTAGLTVRMWRSRAGEHLSRRWPFLLLAIVVIYAAQVVTALLGGSPATVKERASTFVFALFAIGISRSWELLGMRGGGLLDLLVERVDRVGRPAANADGDQDGSPDD